MAEPGEHPAAEAGAPAVPARVDGRRTRGTRKGTLVEQVRLTILDDIVQGRLAPGSVVKLPELAERCGVSRTPVREALALLAREGVISSIPYKGYLVRPIDVNDVSDVFFMRRLLEPPAAERAARSIPEAELSRLEDALSFPPPVSPASMTLQFDEHSHDFHRTIVAAAGSRRLLAAFEMVYNDARRLQYAGIGTPRPDLIHEEHVRILEALWRRDGEAARELMATHIEDMRQRAFEAWAGERR